MVIATPHFGWWFAACFVLAVLTSVVMMGKSKRFYSLSHGVRRPFSIIDLELPASALELTGLLQGIGELPASEALSVRQAVRGQLGVDFLFMPGIYGAIFLLCMRAAQLMNGPLGRHFFALLAWGQLLAWAFDIIENATLLSQLARPTDTLGTAAFKCYLLVVSAKWVLALAGGICGLSILFYFWVAG